MLLLILTGMKRTLLPFLILATVLCTNVRAETESIDLKALAKKARPAVMLLVVSDATGKEAERRGQPRDDLVSFRDPQGEANGSERSQSTGTGFLVSSDGKPKRSGDAAVSFLPQLITNDHVL